MLVCRCGVVIIMIRTGSLVIGIFILVKWLQGLTFIAKHFKGKHNVSNHMILKNYDQVYFSMNIPYALPQGLVYSV